MGAPPVTRPRPDDAGPSASTLDREWAWRRRLRSNPVTRRFYRLGVGLLGVLLLLLAAATGWLPGPGGIPLALAGLAVLASEFAWAARLLDRVKDHLRRCSAWAVRQPRWVQRSGAVGTVLAVLAVVYLYLLVTGLGWLPAGPEAWLTALPGLD